MTIPRGAVFNRERNIQVRDYSGLRYGNITPSDIDAAIEYKDCGFIFIETKFGETEMPFGQKLLLERMCDALQYRKPTLLILTKHYFPSHIDIDMAQTIVVEYRYQGRWFQPRQSETAKELSDRFVRFIENANKKQGESSVKIA